MAAAVAAVAVAVRYKGEAADDASVDTDRYRTHSQLAASMISKEIDAVGAF